MDQSLVVRFREFRVGMTNKTRIILIECVSTPTMKTIMMTMMMMITITIAAAAAAATTTTTTTTTTS